MMAVLHGSGLITASPVFDHSVAAFGVDFWDLLKLFQAKGTAAIAANCISVIAVLPIFDHSIAAFDTGLGDLLQLFQTKGTAAIAVIYISVITAFSVFDRTIAADWDERV